MGWVGIRLGVGRVSEGQMGYTIPIPPNPPMPKNYRMECFLRQPRDPVLIWSSVLWREQYTEGGTLLFHVRMRPLVGIRTGLFYLVASNPQQFTPVEKVPKYIESNKYPYW